MPERKEDRQSKDEKDREAAVDEMERLRQTRNARVEQMLHAEMLREAPGNAAYWLSVVAASFAINLLVLIAIAR